LPFDLAIAIPSRVGGRSGSTSNSAKVARMLKNVLLIESARSYGFGRERDSAGGEGVADVTGIRH
jgi:hypothetical protein